MSHFVTVVLVEKGKSVQEQLARLLEPYNEHTQVEPYQKRCWCVGREAEKAANVAAEKAFPMEELREQFKAKYPDIVKRDWHERSEEDIEVEEKLWQAMLAPRDVLEKATLEAHPMKDKPDPTCGECQGSGLETTTYNPKSKWDWWVIGGRWDGWIQGQERSSENGFNFGEQHHQERFNVIPATEYADRLTREAKNFTPRALVTPDGEWHQRGKMGWFGMSSEDKPRVEWEQEVRVKVTEWAKAKDGLLAVAVDCHI